MTRAEAQLVLDRMANLWRGTITAEAAVEWHRTLAPLRVESVAKALDELKEALDWMPTHRQLVLAAQDAGRRLRSSRVSQSRAIAPPPAPDRSDPAYAAAAMAVIARQRLDGGLVDGVRHVGDHEGSSAEMEQRCPGCAAFIAAVAAEMGSAARRPADDDGRTCHRCGSTGWKQVPVRSSAVVAVAPCDCSTGKRIAEAGQGEHQQGCSCFRCRFGPRASVSSDSVADLVRVDGPRPVDRSEPDRPDPDEVF